MREFPFRVRHARALVALIPAALLMAAAALAQMLPGSTPFGATPPSAPAAPAAPGVPARTRAAAPRPAPRPAATASPVIARVGGHPITQADFDQIATPYFQKLRAQLGVAFANTETQRQASLVVMDELVRREVLAIEAERGKIPVTPAEEEAYFRQDPFFQTNGRFDPAKLAAIRNDPNSNYAVALPLLRRMLATRKLENSLRERFRPTPEQVRAEWDQRSTSVRFKSFALLPRDASFETETTPAEWAEYHRAHPDQFVRRMRVRLRYLLVNPVAGADTAQAAVEAAALARARAVADSMRAGTIGANDPRLVDTDLFEIPGNTIPHVGPVQGLLDTLRTLEADTTLRVAGPYPAANAFIVARVVERQARRTAPLQEVIADVRRRCTAEKRRATEEAARLDYYRAHFDQWRGTRIALTRLTLARPEDPATAAAFAGALAKLVNGFGRARDVRAFAAANGAVAETLSFSQVAYADSLFGPVFVDSLLGAPSPGVVHGPREFAGRMVMWRVDRADTSYVPAYELMRQKSDMGYAAQQRAADEAEAKTYFDAHRDEFKTPERFSLDYAVVPIATPDAVAVTDAEVRHEYDTHPKQYQQDEQVHARHILLATRGLGPEQVRALAARADSLLAALRAGADFAETAKRFSQDPGSAIKGGDLGWFDRGQMVPEFEEAAFKLKPGELSPVVKSMFGYHLIRGEGHKPAGLAPFEQIRADIRTTMATARGDSLARRDAMELVRRLDGATAATEGGIAASYGGIRTAGPMLPTEGLPKLGYLQGLAQDLPRLTPGQWSARPYRVGNQYVVVRLRGREEPRLATFDEARSQAVDAVKTGRKRAAAMRHVAEIRAALAAGGSLDSLAAPFDGLKDSGFLSAHATFVPMLGNAPNVVAKAFAMQPGQVSDTLTVESGVAWIRLEERKSADETAAKDGRAQVEAELLRKGMDGWLEERKRTLKIEILRPELRRNAAP